MLKVRNYGNPLEDKKKIEGFLGQSAAIAKKLWKGLGSECDIERREDEKLEANEIDRISIA